MSPPATAISPSPPRVTWSGEDFDRMSRSGLLDGRRVELIRGEILERPPMNTPHAYSIQVGTYVLLRVFPPDRATMRVQLPLKLGDSRPFPDLAIVAGRPQEVIEHPSTAMLIIEVSDTTLDFD